MHDYDGIFNEFDTSFGNQLSVIKYDAKNIRFDCLKEVIDNFEVKKGRFTDYGFGYIKFIARAC